MQFLASVYFVNQPLHISGIFVAHHQEAYSMVLRPAQPDQQTVNWKAQHVSIVVYIQYTSWWWAENMSEICTGWL